MTSAVAASRAPICRFQSRSGFEGETDLAEYAIQSTRLDEESTHPPRDCGAIWMGSGGPESVLETDRELRLRKGFATARR